MLGKKGEQSFIKIKCQEAKEGELKLLVDSGCVPSIIKAETLHELTTYYPSLRLNLCGISGDRESIGACFLSLKFGKKLVPMQFQIITGPPPGDCDGIIGKNIMKHAVVDFIKKQFTFHDYDFKYKPASTKNDQDQRLIKDLTQSPPTMSVDDLLEMEASPWNQGLKLSESLFTKLKPTPTPQQTTDDEEYVKAFVKNLSIPSVKAFMVATTHQYNSSLTEPLTEIENRIHNIMASFDHKHLSEDSRLACQTLFEEFSELFKLSSDPLPATTAIELNVPLDTAVPIFTPQYKLPPSYQEAAYKQALEWLSEGVIRPSVSPYNSPLLVVPKKGVNPDGSRKLRVCTDLRKINQHVVEAFFHLPPIHALIHRIKKAKFYCTLDLAQGYLQVNVSETDRYKLAFTIKNRRFEFCRVPFGLKTASYCFAVLLTTVLDGLLDGNNIFVYLDDILITADTTEEMFSLLREIFNRFRTHTLRINPEKIEILKNTVSFLGFSISENGITPAFDKTLAISKVPPPRNIHDVLSFLAMTNFFKNHIKDHSELCEPLLKLIRKGADFVWSTDCDTNFNSLKHALTTAPVLAHASELDEVGAKTIVLSDASQFALGSCLAVLKSNTIRPIAYASRTLNKAERNYSAYEREYLGILDAITKRFPFHLLERKFFVLTDHKPLIAMLNAPIDVLSGRTLRWRIKLQQYEFKILYLKGHLNVVADLLSRVENPTTEPEDKIGEVPAFVAYTRSAKNKATAQTPTTPHSEPPIIDDAIEVAIKTAHETLNDSEESDEDSPEPPPKLPLAKNITDPKQQHDLIKLYHVHPLAGHLGVKRGAMRIAERFHWKGMKKMYQTFVENCETCQRCKHRKQPHVALGTVEDSREAFSHVFFDITGPYEISLDGFKYVFSATCATTNFAISICIKTKDTDTIAFTLVEHVFLKYGFAHKVSSDQAKEFTSDVIAKTLKLLKVAQGHSTIYHAQSNPCERYQANLKTYLRLYLTHDKIKSSWSNYVSLATYVFNITPHSRTNFAPYTLLFGRLANDVITKLNIPVLYTYDTFYDELRLRIKNFLEIAKERRDRSKAGDKIKRDSKAISKEFTPGEKVLVKHFTRGTLDDLLQPAQVTKDINEQNVLVKRNKKDQILHKDNVFKLNSIQ